MMMLINAPYFSQWHNFKFWTPMQKNSSKCWDRAAMALGFLPFFSFPAGCYVFNQIQLAVIKLPLGSGAEPQLQQHFGNNLA